MGDEFGCLDALKITNCDEKRRKWCSRAFKNEGDVILPKYRRKNLDRWIRAPPLDIGT